MALALNDRVQQQGTANTTVSFTLTGSVVGFQSFAVVGNGNTTYYAATDVSGNWEVGVGTYSTTGPTLTRTTILASSNSGSAVTFSGTVNVFVTYPSNKSVNLDASGNVSPLGTVASGTWQGTTVGVAYGGTGVTASSGASSVVLRDSNVNVSFNNFIAGSVAVTAAAGTTVLTAASARNQILVGSTTQTFQLPNATTMALGQSFTFINNSSGVLTVKDNASTTVETVPSGGVTQLGAVSIATSAGSWGAYSFIPAAVDWGTNALNLASTVITGGTWNGGTIPTGYGGTGLTTFTTANNAIYSTGASTLAAGTLPVAAGGTGVTTSTGTGSVVLNTSPTFATSILGDFSNATVASRTLFKTSTTNASTGIYAVPNGTSTAASWQATNAADPTNASKILIATNGSTDVQLVSGINGTGTYLPLTFYTNGAEQMRLDTGGNVGIGTSTINAQLQFSNSIGSAGIANKIRLYDGSGTAVFGFGISSGQLNYNCGDGAHVFSTGGGTPTERMRIDASGNVKLSTAGTVIQNSSGRSILNQTGSVLQVVNAAYSTQVTSSAGSFVDTGLTATITPSSTSSKILVLVNQAAVFVNNVPSGFGTFGIYRNGSGICQFGYIVGYLSGSGNNRGGTASASFLDSPASISALTYKTQIYVANGATIDCQRDNAGASTITLIEIAG